MLFNNTLTEITYRHAQTHVRLRCVYTNIYDCHFARGSSRGMGAKFEKWKSKAAAARNACFEIIIALVNYRNWRSGGVAESRSASSLDKKVGLDGNRYRFAQCTLLNLPPAGDWTGTNRDAWPCQGLLFNLTKVESILVVCFEDVKQIEKIWFSSQFRFQLGKNLPPNCEAANLASGNALKLVREKPSLSAHKTFDHTFAVRPNHANPIRFVTQFLIRPLSASHRRSISDQRWKRFLAGTTPASVWPMCPLKSTIANFLFKLNTFFRCRGEQQSKKKNKTKTHPSTFVKIEGKLQQQ